MHRMSHISVIQNLLDRSCSGVERPLPSSFSSGALCPLLFDRQGPLSASSQRWSSWTQLFTQRLWTLGYKEDALASILDVLPVRFCDTIQAASKQVWGVVQAAAAKAPAPPAAVAGGQGAEIAEPAFLECLEDIWELDAEEGFIEFAFDPATQQRSNVILNTVTASLAGMHKEEVPPHPAPCCTPLTPGHCAAAAAHQLDGSADEALNFTQPPPAARV